ncbi:ribonuclease H-like domain-containing protein [Infundibulicybe gibba]|nr:ribonuclease H-like domain-containing protein [Infundibulicybe gibba]
MARIREVWAPNLDAEMRVIRGYIEKHPYVAMDTEFPGVVARPIGAFKTSSDYHYQTMRCNVDLLKIIQVGITLADEDGQYPQEASTWQFNFRFSVSDDMYAPESIELLQKSGIDFQRHEEIGILPNDFAELMITSGMVLSPDTKWISFHSGYDFGYFVKLLTAESLPTTEDAFFELLRVWFPTVYDIKFMMRASKVLKGGLQDVADDLGIMRIGLSHQAGSDSLLTSSTFFKMRELYFNDRIDDAEYSGKLYGLGQTFSATNGLTDPGRGGATIAERDDRGSTRDVHNQTPGANNSGNPQSQGVGMGLGPLPSGNITPLPSGSYGPMSNNGPFLRTSMVGGGR